MNKYEEALDRIKSERLWDEGLGDYYNVFDRDNKDLKLLQELVDKATPMKVDMTTDTLTCPYCETGRVYDWENDKAFRFCADCGQAIDWSTDE